ncbi:MAG: family 78 glycoside hydrolase catalytic domain [Vicinamibacteria bacterium]
MAHRMRTHARAALALLATLGVASASPAATAAAVTGLQAQATDRPLGIDDGKPRLRWRLAGEGRGLRQAAFQVRVASSPELARATSPDIWDSGRVVSSDPGVDYGGRPLRSRTRYYWSVRVWLANGGATEWAEPTWFETAFLDPSEWKASWIAGPERPPLASAEDGARDDAAIRARGELCRPVGWLTSGFAAKLVKNDEGECREVRPAPMLRRSFRVTKPVREARVYASGLAYAALRLNGKPVSDAVLDPAFTDYSKTVLYTTHDVTALLREGENVIATELGSGHFDDSVRSWDWGWEKAQWRATPRLRLELHVVYGDGTRETILSDAGWKASDEGPTRYDSYYLGETYDARRELRGWDEPGFDDSSWAGARVVEGPAGVLRAQEQEPVRVVDTREPGRRREPAPGIVVYDVGQNLTGWAAIRVRAAAGTAIEVFYSEKLGEDGRASTAGNDLVFGQLQTDEYVARGDGDERWTPRFSYKGFQYVQLSAPGGRPLPPDVSVAVERIDHVRTAFAARGTFSSGNATLDRIHRNTAWAVQSNVHGIVTDTPVYEKNGWTGDAQLTAATATLLFDTERLYRKLSRDMLDAQTAEGEVPLLSPSNVNYGYVGKPAFKPAECCGATPAWDAFWFVVPWETYRRNGDRATLAAVYPAMQKYLDSWIPRWTDKDGDPYAGTLTSGLGDWVPPQGVPTVNALASSAYYARLVAIARDAARALGRTADAARYGRLFEKVKADFNARFLSKEGIYREKDGEPFVQTAQILPLAFGLVPAAAKARVVERLAGDIGDARRGHAYVGVLGARDVLTALSANGRLDLAYGLATQTSEPSWGYWTDVAGFTALGEHWPATTRSRNHHFFGAIVQWFYETLAGIRPAAPGYAEIEFRPEMPQGLDHVEASYESVRGTVASSWRRTPDGLEMAVTVPPNATGRVHVPASSPWVVLESGSGRERRAETAPAVHLVGMRQGRAVYTIGSGSYRFRVVARKAVSAK